MKGKVQIYTNKKRLAKIKHLRVPHEPFSWRNRWYTRRVGLRQKKLRAWRWNPLHLTGNQRTSRGHLYSWITTTYSTNPNTLQTVSFSQTDQICESTVCPLSLKTKDGIIFALLDPLSTFVQSCNESTSNKSVLSTSFILCFQVKYLVITQSIKSKLLAIIPTERQGNIHAPKTTQQTVKIRVALRTTTGRGGISNSMPRDWISASPKGFFFMDLVREKATKKASYQTKVSFLC